MRFEKFRFGSRFNRWIIAVSLITLGVFASRAAEPVTSTARLSLTAGWNLLTLPLQPSDTRIAEVLKPIEGEYESVWARPQSQWHGYVPSVPGLKDLNTLDCGTAFWIKMKTAQQLEITGSQPANAANSLSGQSLEPGWHLVGYSSSRVATLPEAFGSLEGRYDKIATATNGVMQWASAEDQMVPFSGYWVHTTQSGKWLSPSFRGRVTDRDTGQPLQGASVSLGGIEADQATDAAGSFVVNGIPDALGQWLTVSAPGYEPFKMLVDTTRGGEVVPYVEDSLAPPGEGSSAAALAPLAAPAFAEVEVPETNSPVVIQAGQLGVALQGKASAKDNGSAIHFDVIFLIDTSGSTARQTGYDLNKDGVNDTVLDVELYACQRLLNRLKSKHVRCGVVKFARCHTKNAPAGGESDGPVLTQQTRIVSELGTVKDLTEIAFDTVAVEGAVGGTHTAAGIDLAIQAFTNAWPADSNPTDVPVRHLVLVTDGIPTLPVEGGYTQETGDRSATLAAAQRAADANVQIHPVVIDSVEAERRLTTMPSVQAISGVAGGLTRVGLHNIHELTGKLDRMTFAGIDDVVVVDRTTGQELVVPTTADGYFEAIVPVALGTNLLEVRFAAADSDKILAKRVSLVVQTNSVSQVEP